MATQEVCQADEHVRLKANNDPWQPLPTLSPAPIDPRYDFIDSERYVQSLEYKLKKLKGGNKKEPTAKDMIRSLEQTKEDHYRQIENASSEYVSNFVQDSSSAQGDTASSYLQRKVHPERVAITAEELVILIRDDHIEKQAAADEEIRLLVEETKAEQVTNEERASSTNGAVPKDLKLADQDAAKDASDCSTNNTAKVEDDISSTCTVPPVTECKTDHPADQDCEMNTGTVADNKTDDPAVAKSTNHIPEVTG